MSSTMFCEKHTGNHYYLVGTTPRSCIRYRHSRPLSSDLGDSPSLSSRVCCVCVCSNMLQALSTNLLTQTLLVLTKCLRGSQYSASLCLQHVPQQEASRGGLQSDQDEVTAVSTHNRTDLARTAGPSRPHSQVGMHPGCVPGKPPAASRARSHTLSCAKPLQASGHIFPRECFAPAPASACSPASALRKYSAL